MWGRWSKKGTEWGKGIAGGGTAGAGEATDDGDSGEDVGCEEEGLSLGCFLGFPWWVLHLFRRGFFVLGLPGDVMVGRRELVGGKLNVVGRRRWRSGYTSCSVILF